MIKRSYPTREEFKKLKLNISFPLTLALAFSSYKSIEAECLILGEAPEPYIITEQEAFEAIKSRITEMKVDMLEFLEWLDENEAIVGDWLKK